MTQPRLLGGRYELDGVVGRGGMAEVYRARDMRLDRLVAIKMLRTDLARDATFQARFRREAQSAASLNHPSIIAVYDTGEDRAADGTSLPYIVMEFVDGRTLRELIQSDRRLLPDRALEILDGVLRALDYSHRNGIVHRDIKPANVMLTRAGDVKVMDFGIARAMADTAATMTQTAQVIGTAQYLSPEQARGERVDARSDLYSAGCLLYELLTGRPPFSGDSPVAIAYQHVKEPPVPPSQIDPEVPGWADALVLKSMAKGADERYQSAAEMRADIQRALQGMPVEARTMAMTGAAQSPGAPPTTALPPYQYGPEQGGRRSDRHRKKGSDGWKTALWILIPLLVIAAAGFIGWQVFATPSDDPKATMVAVPDVTNQDEEAAKQALDGAGLEGTFKEEKSDDVEKGQVIRTDPPAGEQVEKGSMVQVYVSAGPKQVTVPNDLVGMEEDEAKQAIQDAGLVASVTRGASSKEEGVVFKAPKAGKKVEPGSTVKIWVSTGQQKVPNVVGQTQADATKELEKAGYKVEVQQAPSEDAVGTVISTSPGPDSPLAKGKTVVIVVSTGPDDGTDPTIGPTETPPFPPEGEQ